ncbi:MAG: DegT/DnrJ/EryC1/StrS family aminotransferase [Anaerolineae bacterium]|nr:DegT/DnrJ/EryC1/StrS family aminotransferase [Anaerolineae bacterium]
MKLAKVSERQSRQYLRDITRREHAILTGRAAAGIWSVLRAWSLHDKVILLPDNTCYIVLWAVLKSGNLPLLVDVDRNTANLTVANLDVHRTAHPAVVIPCHMYGLPAPMKSICEWAKANGVKVIEDAALALGATVDGQPAGSWGDASIVSFGLGKIVDNQVGGALLTNDSLLADSVTKLLAELPVWDDRLMVLTNQWNGLYWPLHQYESQNPRLLDLYPQLFTLYGDLTAYQLTADDWADLPALLRDLPDNLARRAQLATLYDVLLQTDNPLILPSLERPMGSILWRYPLLVKADMRDELLGYLWEQGIHEATRWYPPLRPMTTALAPDLSQPPTPAADALGASIINLPLDADIDEQFVRRVAERIHAFLDDI